MKKLSTHSGIELPDWKGNNPKELVGLMTDKGKILAYNSTYNCWTVEGHGQVSRNRQKQRPGKTKIVYPKIQS